MPDVCQHNLSEIGQHISTMSHKQLGISNSIPENVLMKIFTSTNFLNCKSSLNIFTATKRMYNSNEDLKRIYFYRIRFLLVLRLGFSVWRDPGCPGTGM